jgi:hypothetical protein
MSLIIEGMKAGEESASEAGFRESPLQRSFLSPRTPTSRICTPPHMGSTYPPEYLPLSPGIDFVVDLANRLMIS